MLVHVLPGGVKIAKGTATLDNTAGASAADINATITISELEYITGVLGVVLSSGAGASAAILRSYSISGNTVTVTANIPAGEAHDVEVTVIGY